MTTFDVIGGVELTMSAAIMVAVFSIVMGREVARRVTLAAVLSGWFVIVVVLAATRALHYEHGVGSPGLGLAVVVPVVVMWIATLRAPLLREGLERAPLAILAGVNVVRVLGGSFVILYADKRLPAPFALEAGWGGIVAGG